MSWLRHHTRRLRVGIVLTVAYLLLGAPADHHPHRTPNPPSA